MSDFQEHRSQASCVLPPLAMSPRQHWLNNMFKSSRQGACAAQLKLWQKSWAFITCTDALDKRAAMAPAVVMWCRSAESCTPCDEGPPCMMQGVLCVPRDVVMLVDPMHSLIGCDRVLKPAFGVASKRNS